MQNIIARGVWSAEIQILRIGVLKHEINEGKIEFITSPDGVMESS